MNFFFLLLFTFSCLFVSAQGVDKDDLDTRIHLLTTIVRGQLRANTNQGSGFFYSVFDSIVRDGWKQVDEIWLVTNRHLVFFNDSQGNEQLPDLFTFYLRRIDGESLKWLPVQITKKALEERLYVYSEPTIDIAVILVDDLIVDKIKSDSKIAQIQTISAADLPGKESKLYSHVADDVVTIGYPEEFYDDVNLFPIVKSGIIASRWGIGFKGNPYFLIDSRLFPGSSGSLVISKPTNTTFEEGRQYYSETKQFSFLGVYSGKLKSLPSNFKMDKNIDISKMQSLDVGIVWYGELIADLIKSSKQEKEKGK